MRENARRENRQVVLFVIGRGHDDDVERLVHGTRLSAAERIVPQSRRAARRIGKIIRGIAVPPRSAVPRSARTRGRRGIRRPKTGSGAPRRWESANGRATFHTPYATPSRNAAAAIGRNTRSGLKMVTIFRMMTKNFAPSRASLIFDAPTRGRAFVGSNAHVVSRLDEGERRRSRCREPVGQEVQELEQVFPAGCPESRREIAISRFPSDSWRSGSACCCRRALPGLPAWRTSAHQSRGRTLPAAPRVGRRPPA